VQREEIEVTIRPDGTVEYTIKGVKGSSCENISQLLERLGKVEEEVRTADYYAHDPDAHVHIAAGE
jgi:hypothetical protein